MHPPATPRTRPVRATLLALLLASGCQCGANTRLLETSDAGPSDAGPSDAGPSDAGTTGPTCGNGRLDPGEACDTALAPSDPHACPASCDDGDACTTDALAGSDCATHCSHEALAASPTADGCCPRGATPASDPDCAPFRLDGPATNVCGTFDSQGPTIAGGGGHFAVGCIPNGSQRATPTVSIVDASGSVVASHDLLTADGLYFTDIRTAFHDGRFQVTYEYDCADSGSWAAGWGWGCIDFREYAPDDGRELTGSVVFGARGHNGHPVLDWTGSEFGFGWVSYDTLLFRPMSAQRQLLPTADRGANLTVASDPQRSDSRDGARTRIVWDPASQSFGLFSILGSALYFARVDAGGTVVQPLTGLGLAYADSYNGELDAAVKDGVFVVTYSDRSALWLDRISAAGARLSHTKVLDTAYAFPVLVPLGDAFYVVLDDTDGASATAMVKAFDASGTPLPERDVVLGPGLFHPSIAVDPDTKRAGLVYIDGIFHGVVKFRPLALGR